MWVAEDIIENLLLLCIETKGTLRFCQTVLGCKSHNRLLSENCWKDRNTDIKLSSVNHDGDTTILWFSLLCYIHTAYDLDTGCDTCQYAEVV